MKKAMLILAVAAIGVLIAVGLMYVQKGESVSLTAAVPAGPVFYLEVDDLDTRLQSFSESQLWQSLQQVDLPALYQGTPGEARAEAFLDTIRGIVEPSGRQTMLKKLFGKEFAVAAYADGMPEAVQMTPQRLQEQFLVVARPQTGAQLLEVLSGFFLDFSKDSVTEKIEYKQHTITLVTDATGRNQFGYVRIGDLLVFGRGDKAAKLAVDVAAGDRPSLQSDERYHKARKDDLQDAHTKAYLDVAQVVGRMRDAVMAMIPDEARNSPQAAQVVERFDQMQGLTAISYSERSGEMSEGQMLVYYDLARMTSEMKKTYSCKPGGNATLTLVPQNVLGYQWSNCNDFSYYWDQTKAEMTANQAADPNQPSADMITTTVTANTGLDLEKDILPLLGQEFGGFLTGLNAKGLFPVPELVLFLSITDQAKAAEMLSGLFENQPMMRPLSEEYAGETLNYLVIPLVTNLEPTYVVTKDYFLLATNRDVIKSSLDARTGTSPNAASGLELPEWSEKLSGDNNSVVILRGEKLSVQLQQVAEWAGRWLKMRSGKQMAFKRGSEQRLADLQNEIRDLETVLADKESQLPTLTADGEEARLLGDEIAQLKSDLKADQAKAEELQSVIGSYDRQDNSPERIDLLFERIVKPLLNTLQHFQVLVGRTRFGDGTMESLYSWRIQ